MIIKKNSLCYYLEVCQKLASYACLIWGAECQSNGYLKTTPPFTCYLRPSHILQGRVQATVARESSKKENTAKSSPHTDTEGVCEDFCAQDILV